jgi:hypothetical protein
MYLFETDFGEVFKPRPKAPPAKLPPKAPEKPPPKAGKVAVKEGHWRFCLAPSGGTVSCDLNLKVRFRRSFDGFLREVEGAYGRWMERSTARMLVKKLQKELKQWHEDMLYYHVLDNDPLFLVAGLSYRKSNGTWLVNDSSLRQWHRLIDI